MGSKIKGRTAGKPKKKSIKANVTSKFSSKRRLSRMGKKVKKDQMGPSTEFVTRSTALKKLQISLKDFRRLCILKGIFPRVPTKAPKGSDKVYYDIKDLSYLAHEPLLQKFREFKTFMKKIRNAAGRNQPEEARRKNAMKPQFILDHLVKERYPRFIDALRDMDDALCMVHLFAALPSVGRVTAERTSTCQTLVRHWQYYVARAKTLRKVFVSVKGVYFQCDVMGEPITWLEPHAFAQKIPSDVDVRVMLTFLDFYEVFLKFVLFKLYSTIELSYPPVEDRAAIDAGGFLLAVRSSNPKNEVTTNTEQLVGDGGRADVTVQSKHDKKKLQTLELKLAAMTDSSQVDDEDDSDVDMAAPLTDAFSHLHGDMSEENGGDGIDESDRHTFHEESEASNNAVDECSSLFKGLRFFVCREVPLEWLQLCIVSFGGTLGWDGEGSPFSCKDASITHQIVDRPVQGIEMNSTREYIQPQWVFDSINARILLPVSRYRPGVTLPPHLSPFVDDEKEGYLPAYREEIKKLKSSVEMRSSEQGVTISTEQGEEDDEDSDYEAGVEAERSGVSFSASKQQQSDSDESSEDEDVSDEDDNESSGDEGDLSEQSEGSDNEDMKNPLQKKGPRAVVYDPSDKSKTNKAGDADLADESQLSKIMMNKKTRRLYDRMHHGLDQKKQQVENLKTKRQQLESAGAEEEKKSTKRTKRQRSG